MAAKKKATKKAAPKKGTAKRTSEPKRLSLVNQQQPQQQPRPAQHEAQARAQACNAELAQVLQRYGCVIQPYIVPTLEPVGQMGDCAQISASYGIRALPRGD